MALEWLIRLVWKPPLTPPGELDWRYDVGKHKIMVNWEKSKCSSVTSQRISVEINGEEHQNAELQPDVTNFGFSVEEYDVVHVTVFALIDTKASDAARMTFIVPCLSKPIAPANLKWEVVESFPPEQDECGVDN